MSGWRRRWAMKPPASAAASTSVRSPTRSTTGSVHGALLSGKPPVGPFQLYSQRKACSLIWDSDMSDARDKADVWQGTLALMVLKTIEGLGPEHGFGIARRIEQTSGHRLTVNAGTLYPTLLKLEQQGFLASE